MSLEVAVVRRAAPKMVVVWRGSLEESWVLRISLEVAMVWRASPEMVVVRCTALEEAVVQRASPSRLWFGEALVWRTALEMVVVRQGLHKMGRYHGHPD